MTSRTIDQWTAFFALSIVPISNALMLTKFLWDKNLVEAVQQCKEPLVSLSFHLPGKNLTK